VKQGSKEYTPWYITLFYYQSVILPQGITIVSKVLYTRKETSKFLADSQRSDLYINLYIKLFIYKLKPINYYERY